MRPFVTSFLAGLLSMLVFSILFVLFIVWMVAALTRSFSDDAYALEHNSILKINVTYPLEEQTKSGMPAALALMGLEREQGLGLNDVLAAIRNAETDDKVQGIYLQLGVSPNGYGTMQEIREALADFKSRSGKFVIAYGEIINQNAFYLGSVADKIYMHPAGFFEFKGLAAQVTYYTGAMEKLGVKTQIFYDGKYKSATEPFRLDKMSAENRLQLETFLEGMYASQLEVIASARKLDPAVCRSIADSLSAWYPAEAARLGLLDGVKYFDEVEKEMQGLCGLRDEVMPEMVALSDYRETFFQKAETADEGTIAIVYAEGTIVDGRSSSGFLGSADFADMMEEVREDEDVKAVVLRVNSPGGSAVASDVMWRAIETTKEKKPVIVSMGNYAASGGYMISCNANKIFAQQNTLTGSIGVFLIVPEISELMQDKLGITFDTAMTSAYADFPSVVRPFAPLEKNLLQAGVDSTYLHFKQMVAKGRNMPVDQVEALAQGRVWTGSDAVKNGLADAIGGIDEAITAAAEAAGISNYFTVEFPEQKKSVLDDVMQGLTEETTAKMQSAQLGLLYPHYKNMQQLMERPVIQARLPYELVIR